MKPECRALGAEDLVVGARFCKECYRYKLPKNECQDFVFGGATLVGKVETATGKSKWKVERKSK